MSLREFVMAIPIGLAFGYVIQTSGVYSPAVIRAQFVFHKEIMMKMFLGALAGSSFSMALLHLIKPKEFEKARESKGWGDKGAVGSVIGGLIQGAGMALGGSCPGMVYAQLGSGSQNAVFLYLGGLAGAFLYGLIHPYVVEHLVNDFSKTFSSRFSSMHLEQNFFNGNYLAVALSFGSVALAVALALDQAVPWRQDVSDVGGVNPSLAMNPILSGLIVGSLQVPVLSLLGTLLGASSGYSVISSQAYRVIPEGLTEKHTYAKGFISNKASWQIGFGIGIVLIASITSGFALQLVRSLPKLQLPQSPTATVNPIEAFLGGLFIVFGARLAGGCASGHGISGLPALHIVSWYVVPAMFASGIVVGNILSLIQGRSVYLLNA